MESDLIES